MTVTEELKELDIANTDKQNTSNITLADEHKTKGNKYFAELHFTLAIDEYTAAIELNPTNAIYYSNRAACHIKLESYGASIEDATKAIQLDKQFVKAYYRRATSYFSLNKLRDALKDYKAITKLKPNDKDAKSKYEECEKAVRAQAFLKAIESEDTPLPSTTIDVNSIPIDYDKYNGPKLDETTGLPDQQFIDQLVIYYKEQGRLPRKYIYMIVMNAIKLFKSLPTLIYIDQPVETIDNNNTVPYDHITVCGDVHGQYYDLVNIFEINGKPSPTNPYLFNGDFVDRGSFSLEIIVLFLCYKLCYPQYFHMLRGNHESHSMNQIYGFKGEVENKVDKTKCYDLFTELFNCLPLAGCIGNTVLIVHGGLFSQNNVTLDDINKIDRFCQPSDTGLMSELMWSDPQPQYGRAPSKRGVGLQFGPDITEAFLKHNNLELLVRSHEVKEQGYEIMHNGKCITVFSAPNYCDTMGNKGAFVRFKYDMKPDIKSFTHVEHPKSQPMQYASPLMRMGI